jgi:Protein of unknown function (DUF3352)
MLRRARYAIQDFLFLIGRAPRTAWRALRSRWNGLSMGARQRVAIVAGAAVVLVLVVAVAVPALPCQFPGGDACAPDDDSDDLVPADSLAYVHVTIDPDSDQYEELSALIDEVPGLAQQAIGRALALVPGSAGSPAAYNREIRPWFGGQAAVAIVPSGGGAEQVQLLEEGDSERARKYASSLAAGGAQKDDYHGVEISTDERGLSTASVGGFLAIGTADGVRQVVDASEGVDGARSLSDEDVAEDVRDDLPPERFAEAFVSKDGIERLIAGERGPLSSLEPFVDAGASRGAGISLGVSDGGLEVAVRSDLDPERSKADPGFFAAFPAFEPKLVQRLGDDALGYVGIGDPGKTVRELIAQAAAEAPGLAEAFTELAERLRDLGEVNIERQLLPALGGEAAFGLEPGPEGNVPSEPTTTVPAPTPEGLEGGPAPVVPDEPPVPVLQFLAEGVDSDKARKALANLQTPIAEALGSETSLQAPVFDRRELEGVEVQTLRVSPTVNLTYALADDRLAIATQPSGVEEVIRGEGGLNESDAYERATDDFPSEPSFLIYLNLTGLIRLGEREGLAEDPNYALFAQEIQTLEALGLAVDSGAEQIDTDARLVLSEADKDEPGPAVPSD